MPVPGVFEGKLELAVGAECQAALVDPKNVVGPPHAPGQPSFAGP